MSEEKKQQSDHDLAMEDYHIGCSFIALREFKVALKYFRSAIKLRGEAWPDIHRNMGWCHYRIGEFEAYQDNYDKAFKHFDMANEYYTGAQVGFLEMENATKDPKYKAKCQVRIEDCEKRRHSVDGLREFLLRRQKFQERLQAKKSHSEQNTKVPPSDDDDLDEDDWEQQSVDLI